MVNNKFLKKYSYRPKKVVLHFIKKTKITAGHNLVVNLRIEKVSNPMKQGGFIESKLGHFLTDLVLSLQIIRIGPSECGIYIFLVVSPKRDGQPRPPWIS